jgi:hypothetical protein
MPGRRGKNLRSGDLSEELGVLLLKGIAVVASVPRPEDIGYDGVATLLREDEAGYLYAEDSFYVQFKSASVKRITYRGHEAEWLANLKLPFFIGSVDSATSSICFYTTVRISHILIEQRYSRLRLCLDPQEEGDDPAGQRTFNIGPPLLQWSLKDLRSAKFRKTAYDMLTTVIQTEERNIRHRCVNYAELLQWTTNEEVIFNGYMMTSNDDVAIPLILKEMAPYVLALTTNAASLKWPDDHEAVTAIFQLLKRYGVRPHPVAVHGLGLKIADRGTIPTS